MYCQSTARWRPSFTNYKITWHIAMRRQREHHATSQNTGFRGQLLVAFIATEVQRALETNYVLQILRTLRHFTRT